MSILLFPSQSSSHSFKHKDEKEKRESIPASILSRKEKILLDCHLLKQKTKSTRNGFLTIQTISHISQFFYDLWKIIAR